MSTAILYSGQLRTFARCYPTQRWHVLRHFADPHFFFTVQSQPTEPGYLEALSALDKLKADFGKDRVHTQYLTDPDLSADLTPQLSAAYHQAPYANAAPAHRLLLQHWYQAQVYKHFLSAAAEMAPCKFETLLRLRPDLYFHSFSTSDYIDGNGMVCDNLCLTPWWGRFGGLNDRFAIMGPTAADAYFDVYSKIPELLHSYGAPFHPETLLAARLEIAQIEVRETLRAEFSTLRLDGTSRPPEISPIDLAHCALK